MQKRFQYHLSTENFFNLNYREFWNKWFKNISAKFHQAQLKGVSKQKNQCLRVSNFNLISDTEENILAHTLLFLGMMSTRFDYLLRDN